MTGYEKPVPNGSGSSWGRWRPHRVTVLLASIILAALVGLVVMTPARDPYCLRSPLVEGSRARLVLVNALAVANPDYQINFGDLEAIRLARQEVSEICEEGVAFPLEARAPYSLSSGKSWRARISFGSGDALEIPRLRDWTLGMLSRQVGRTSPTSRPKTSEVRDVLKRMGEDVQVQVMVSLTSPMAEEQAKRLLFPLKGFDLVFLSPGGAGKPPSWDFSFCEQRGISGCSERQSLVDSFRRWVSLLKAEDSPALAEFGLRLTELRDIAGEGKVYGFIASGGADEVEQLLARSEVAWGRIVNLQMTPYFGGV